MVALAQSHRSAAFAADLARTKALLCRMTRAKRAEILLGSGTLANDVVAAQLSLDPASGLVLTNGEFGERLVDHAGRFKLRCEVMRWAWGCPFDLSAIERRLTGPGKPQWVWCVHLETSTGVLNDLDALRQLCSAARVRLCVDAVSSLGTVPLDLSEVYFASGVSGKGLCGFAGLAVVLHHHDVHPSRQLPRYLDLGLYARTGGVPFTHSSNLVGALSGALEGVDWETRYSAIAQTSSWLRARLRQAGFAIVSREADSAPGIITIALPRTLCSGSIGTLLEQQGYLLAAHSEYLRERNWIQISLMSQPSPTQLDSVVRALCGLCSNALAAT